MLTVLGGLAEFQRELIGSEHKPEAFGSVAI